jgi:hypothetical protein
MTRRPFRPVKPRPVGTPKRAIADLFEQAGGLERVTVRLGVRQTVAYAWTDPQAREEISFARVAALTDPTATAATEYLAGLAGGVFLPVPPIATPIARLTAESIRRHGRAAGDLVEALADGRLTRAEAARALPDLEAALRTLALLRASVAEVANPRVEKD